MLCLSINRLWKRMTAGVANGIIIWINNIPVCCKLDFLLSRPSEAWRQSTRVSRTAAAEASK